MDHRLFSLLPLAVVATLLFKLIAVGTAALVLRLRKAHFWRIYRVPLAADQLRREARAILPVLAIDGVLLIAFTWLMRRYFVPTSLASVTIAFIWMFIAFEIWFYVTHWLLHTRLFYPIHAQHHIAHVTNPVTALSFSLVERLILMGGGLALAGMGAKFLPFANLGLLVYLLFNYTMVLVGHCNTELLPSWFVRSWLGQIFFTPTYHAMHHARYAGNYGLFTVTLDRLFRTEFDDYIAVHTRARNGDGLDRLGQRLAPVCATNNDGEKRVTYTCNR